MKPQKRGFSGAQVALIVLVAILITGLATFWLVRSYFFPKAFDPVVLSSPEQQQLDQKLRRIRVFADAPGAASDAEPPLPEPYSEENASREVRLSEKEVNSLIGKDSDLAKRLAIDLASDLASATLLIPVEPDFPILGGRTLKVQAGLEMAFRNERPMVILKGVSIMGVPLPNAWLGNLKNVDLVSEFGGDPGFWQSFAAGVEQIRIDDGELLISLRE